ncbi:hypothetical protein [Devosia insulae]|nr:hypothetical protein [Devosia insulae]
MAGRKTHDGYRDGGNGQFITKKEAATRPPAEVIKERIPNPGRGDTKK